MFLHVNALPLPSPQWRAVLGDACREQCCRGRGAGSVVLVNAVLQQCALHACTGLCPLFGGLC